jgi:hypothetical protein
VLLRGGGFLEALLLLLLLALVASASATCDEDQRARRDACETELEEAAASYLFPRLYRHPLSSLLGLSVHYLTTAVLQVFPRRGLLGNRVNKGWGRSYSLTAWQEGALGQDLASED